MGHAGAIISGGKGTAAEKMTAMKKAGIHVVENLAEMGTTKIKAIQKKKKTVTKKSSLIRKKTVKKSAIKKKKK